MFLQHVIYMLQKQKTFSLMISAIRLHMLPYRAVKETHEKGTTAYFPKDIITWHLKWRKWFMSDMFPSLYVTNASYVEEKNEMDVFLKAQRKGPFLSAHDVTPYIYLHFFQFWRYI